MSYRVAVAGASGYVGGELLRLILQHPELELGAVTANTNAGQSLGSLHPHLPAIANRLLVETNEANLAGHDVVFLALPHATSAEVAKTLSDSTLVLDCGADFRLEDPSAWEKFYGTPHAGTWTYGMPELTLAEGGKQRGRLRAQNRVAVPGCNVTALTLALAPGLTAGLFDPIDIVSVMSVGTSGAGRALKSDLLASEVLGSARAYGVGGVHRHTPEMEQNLTKAAGVRASVSFTPVLVPMSRGILAVNTVRVADKFDFETLKLVYQDAYSDEPFIQLLSDQLPTTAAVLGSNNVQISLAFDQHTGRVVVVSAIDNLVKGTAGAAIQSMNLALGLTETSGLMFGAVAP